MINTNLKMRKNITEKTYKAMMSKYKTYEELVEDNPRLYRYLRRKESEFGFDMYNQFEDIVKLPDNIEELVALTRKVYPTYKSFSEDKTKILYKVFSTKACMIG